MKKKTEAYKIKQCLKNDWRIEYQAQTEVLANFQNIKNKWPKYYLQISNLNISLNFKNQ